MLKSTLTLFLAVSAAPVFADATEDFLKAARKADVKKMEKALNAGADVNAPDASDGGKTALLFACGRDNAKAVNFLLEKNAEANATDESGSNCLHYLAAGKNPALISTVSAKADGSRLNSKGEFPLMIAAKAGKGANIQALVAAGAQVNQKNAEGVSALFAAVSAGSKAGVQAMLTAGADSAARDGRGRVLIHYLAASRLYDTIPDAIKAGADIRVKDNEGNTPLAAAVIANQTGAIKLLLKNGAAANDSVTAEGQTMAAFWYALQKKNYQAFSAILAGGADVNAKNPEGKTLLAVAIDGNSTWLADQALAAGADVNLRDENNDTPLIRCARKNRGSIMDKLLAKGADLRQKDSAGDSVLIVLTRNFSADLLPRVLKAGGDVHDRDKSGEPAILIAHEEFMAKFNKTRSAMFVALVRAGGDVNIRSRRKTALLHEYVARGVEYYVKLLLDHGARVNETDADTNTALHLAVNGKKYDICRTLISKGANINARGQNAQTPLTLAAFADSLSLVRLVAEAGADVQAANSEGITALRYALRKGNREMVEYLLSKGADGAEKDKFGNYLIHEVAGSGRFAKNNPSSLIESLKKSGAKVDQANRYGNTPVMYAINRHNPEMIRKLLAGGADVNRADNAGNTPLHKAVLTAHYGKMKNDELFEVFSALLENGAATDKVNGSGRTPLMEAVKETPGGDDSAALQAAQVLLDFSADIHFRGGGGRTALDLATAGPMRSLLDANQPVRAAGGLSFSPLTGSLQSMKLKTGLDGNLYLTAVFAQEGIFYRVDNSGSVATLANIGGARDFTVTSDGTIFAQTVTAGSFSKNGKPDKSCTEGENLVINLVKVTEGAPSVLTLGKNKACANTAGLGLEADDKGMIGMAFAYSSADRYLNYYNQDGKQKWPHKRGGDWNRIAFQNGGFELQGSTLHLIDQKGRRSNYVEARGDGANAFHFLEGKFDAYYSASAKDRYLTAVRYDKNKRKNWERAFRVDQNLQVSDAAADNEGNFYIAGTVTGRMHGQNSAGGKDVFVMKLSPQGTRQWTRLAGGSGDDSVQDLHTDSGGNAWIAMLRGGQGILCRITGDGATRCP